MTFRTGEADNFKQVFNVTQNQIRNFNGCSQLRLLESGNVFFTYSVWESEIHLNAYRESELFKQTWAKTKVLFEKPAEAWTCEAMEVGKDNSNANDAK